MKHLLILLACFCLLLPGAAKAQSAADAEAALWETSEEADWDLSHLAAEMTEEDEAAMNQIAAMLDDQTRSTEQIDPDDPERNERLPEHVVNILLLGVDNRSVGLESGRADANIICSVDKKTGTLRFVSISRDTAVSIPGYESRSRINEAFRRGSMNRTVEDGAALAVRTVNRNFDLNIQYYVVINIHGLADIIESLGGLDMDLTKEEAVQINYELHEKEPMDNVRRDRLLSADGVQHLDGMECVTYGRIRNLVGQNDLDRGQRQRKLLTRLFEKVSQDCRLSDLLELIETALPYARTNIPLADLLDLGMTVLSGDTVHALPYGGSIEQLALPAENLYHYKKFGDNALLYLSPKSRRQTISLLQTFLYGQTY